MGFWSWLTGKEAIEQIPKVTDAIINTGDALFYTEEEEARDDLERIDKQITQTKVALDWIRETLKAGGAQSVVRRVIALLVVGNFLLAFNIALYYAITDKAETTNRIVDTVQAFKLGWAVITILTFYFGVHTLRYLNRRAGS